MKKDKTSFPLFCEKCQEQFTIGESDFLPGKNDDINGDEYLVFWAICPKCGHPDLYEECTSTDYEIIPKDMKLRIMKRHAHTAEEELDLAWRRETLKEVIAGIEKTEDLIRRKRNAANDDKVLFDGWKDSATIVRELKQMKG